MSGRAPSPLQPGWSDIDLGTPLNAIQDVKEVVVEQPAPRGRRFVNFIRQLNPFHPSEEVPDIDREPENDQPVPDMDQEPENNDLGFPGLVADWFVGSCQWLVDGTRRMAAGINQLSRSVRESFVNMWTTACKTSRAFVEYHIVQEKHGLTTILLLQRNVSPMTYWTTCSVGNIPGRCSHPKKFKKKQLPSALQNLYRVPSSADQVSTVMERKSNDRIDSHESDSEDPNRNITRNQMSDLQMTFSDETAEGACAGIRNEDAAVFNDPDWTDAVSQDVRNLNLYVQEVEDGVRTQSLGAACTSSSSPEEGTLDPKKQEYNPRAEEDAQQKRTAMYKSPSRMRFRRLPQPEREEEKDEGYSENQPYSAEPFDENYNFMGDSELEKEARAKRTMKHSSGQRLRRTSSRRN